MEDTEAAKIKRNQVAMLQPTVFDLSVTEIAALRQKIFGMLKLINGQETSPEAQDAFRKQLPAAFEVVRLFAEGNIPAATHAANAFVIE